jgi:hypothetical protein
MLLPLVASADAVEIGGIYYNLVPKAKQAEVTSNPSRYSGDITIPKSFIYKGITYSVTSIGDYAFSLCYGLTSVSIPNSVTSIGDTAFHDCFKLTSITIPNSVTSIGNSAFENCESLASVVIPNSVTSIGNQMFSNCKGLTSITIPNSVTSIGERAFFRSRLTSIIIPNSVTSIGKYAFADCVFLKSLTIPNSVTRIGKGAFSTTEWYYNQPNGLVYAGNVAYEYKGTMPIGYKISLKNETLSIAEYAFYDCDNLTSITIPNSVKSIGEYAFYDCDNLTSITIPNSVKSIGKSAFYDCDNLTTISIHSTNIRLVNGTFHGTKWYDNQPDGLIYIDKILYGWKGGRPVFPYPKIKEGTIGIADEAFNYNSRWIESIEIPNSVTSIGKYAFADCVFLKSVTIPNSVTNIGDYAFSRCSGLTSATIGKSVKNIGDYAFYNCSNLLRITCRGINPPICGKDVFLGVDTKKCEILVPDISYDAYNSIETWKEFNNGNLRINNINEYLDPADVQYKKTFRLEGKKYTMYFVERGKALHKDKNLVVDIYFIPDDYKYDDIFGDVNIPPHMVEVVYHDLGDPDNKDFCSVVLSETICDKNGKNSKNIKREVIIPEDIANDIIDLYNGDTKYKLVGYLLKNIKEVKTTEIRTFK